MATQIGDLIDPDDDGRALALGVFVQLRGYVSQSKSNKNSLGDSSNFFHGT
jgi:hypothetical protein